MVALSGGEKTTLPVVFSFILTSFLWPVLLLIEDMEGQIGRTALGRTRKAVLKTKQIFAVGEHSTIAIEINCKTTMRRKLYQRALQYISRKLERKNFTPFAPVQTPHSYSPQSFLFFPALVDYAFQVSMLCICWKCHVCLIKFLSGIQ